MDSFNLRRADAGMLHFPRRNAKNDGGVRTLVLSTLGTLWRPETQRKGAGGENDGNAEDYLLEWKGQLGDGKEGAKSAKFFAIRC